MTRPHPQFERQQITHTAEPSVLAMLRSLAPRRRLTPSEHYRVAELQANRLLRHFGIQTDTVPAAIISQLPRLRVVHIVGLGSSGSAHWNGQLWLIAVNADEHPLRQRFSLMHEFKHVIDHTSKQLLYSERPGVSAYDQAERVADYFAACALMPKRVVKRLWCQPGQTVARLAADLQVSPAALRYRLDQLGLTERAVRCDRQTWRTHKGFVAAAISGERQ